MSATKTKSKAAASAAAAALDEANPQPKSFAWRDITFELPTQLPATIAFDIAEVETGSLGALFRFLTTLLGEEQIGKVRAKLDADGEVLDDLDKVLAEIMDGALGQYGLNLGE